MLNNVLKYVEKLQILILGVLISIMLISAVHILVSALPNDGITVTGSASKIVQSDNGVLNFSIKTKEKNVKLAYAVIQKQIPIVKNYLKTKVALQK